MSAEGTKGTDGKTYYSDGSNITVKDSGGNTTYSGPAASSSSTKPVTDMSQWYRETEAAQGYKPTADQVSAAMDSYKNYVAGKAPNQNDNRVWNQYGEVIGYSPSGGYTDFSYQAANATVNPNRVWDANARNDPSTQRYLTATPLTGTYLDYDTGQWSKAPEHLQKGGPSFINYAGLPLMANQWLEANPNSLWDEQGLIDLWKGQYQDLSELQGMMNQYAHEFQGGIAPTLHYNPNTIYGDAYTTSANAVNLPAIGTVGKEPWEVRLGEYRTNPKAGYDEIARAQQVYNEKMAMGDIAGAQAAHTWANQIRDAMGISDQFDRVTGAPLNEAPLSLGANNNLYTQNQSLINLANENKADVYNTQNQLLQAYLEAQKEFARFPEYRPPEREPFRFTHQPVSITSDGSDIHIPTLAAKQQWEAEQDAIQNRAYQQYAIDYDRNKNIYTTQTEWLKLAMAEQQRQDDIAREAARYQAESALAKEKQDYERAWAMFNAGIATDEIYKTLGIPAGSKPFDQVMNEWKMGLAEREHSLNVSKAYSGGSGSSNSSPYYDGTQGERTNIMTGSLLELADKQYQLNKQGSGNASKYPLYYALDTLFHNSTWAKDIASTGADKKAVADYLIVKYTNMSPEQYFKTDKKAAGSRVESAYKQLLTKTDREDWEY